VTSEKDYYSLLGVPRNATTDELRRAFREAALRLHPDKNVRPGETELFLEVNRAYEILIDPKARKGYDQDLFAREQEMAESASFRAEVLQSRQRLLQLDEPQVHYLLLDVLPAEQLPDLRPPINLSIVVDRSTSMRGPRLDQIRAATLAILQDLTEEDSASIIAFSDKAEVIVNPRQAREAPSARARLSMLQAGGGTEIGQGIQLGLDELRKNFSRDGINHMILLTDGRTYGDESECLDLADQSAELGVTIHGVGIGSEWSDRLLDDLAGRTGGGTTFLDSAKAITGILRNIFDGLSQNVASRLSLEGSVAQQVDLRSAFRLMPEPMPMGDSLPIKLGHLPKEGLIRLLLELVIHPIGAVNDLTLAHFTIDGDVLGKGSDSFALPVQVAIPVSDDPDPEPPPEEIVNSLSLIAMYRMQEKARHEAELGQTSKAARRLETLATHLLASGERDLAKAALSEADRLAHSRRISSEGEKILKYGTRALLLPARTGDSK
jgi:Ca-activated chloride channel family protein